MPTTLPRFGILSASLLALAGTFAAVGCATNSTATPESDAGPTPTGDGGACPADGTGTISVVVNGLPTGVAAKVKLTGAISAEVTETATLADKPAGSYSVEAERVAQPDPIVRTLFEPKVTVSESSTSFCLGKAKTVEVTISYSAIAPSHKLWSNGGAASDLLAFAGADLAATGSPAAKVTLKGTPLPGGAGNAAAFDKDGNLWTLGGTSAAAPLLRFPAASLGTSGDKTPDRQIEITLSGCSPSLHALAFDANGALWVANECDSHAMRVDPAKLSGSGEFTPAESDKAKLTKGARSIAFDKAGNMWVSGETTITRFPAATLAAGQTPASDVVLTTKTDTDPLPPDALAFDAEGNLWVSQFEGNAVFKLTPAQLATTANVIPGVLVGMNVLDLVYNIAFDESGGLWLAGATGKISRLAGAQLVTSATSVAPETVVTSADLGSSTVVAFFPAPAGLPLYSRFE